MTEAPIINNSENLLLDYQKKPKLPRSALDTAEGTQRYSQAKMSLAQHILRFSTLGMRTLRQNQYLSGPWCLVLLDLNSGTLFSPHGQRITNTDAKITLPRKTALEARHSSGVVTTQLIQLIACIVYRPHMKFPISNYNRALLYQLVILNKFSKLAPSHNNVTNTALLLNDKLFAISSFNGVTSQWSIVDNEQFGLPIRESELANNATLSSPSYLLWQRLQRYLHGSIQIFPQLKNEGSQREVRDKTTQSCKIKTVNAAKPSTGITSIAYTANGKLIASGSALGVICQWDATTGKLYGPLLDKHTGKVNSVAYSPSGEFIASGSDDTTVRLWEVATGEPLKSYTSLHTSAVISVAFSPNGKSLKSASKDGTFSVIDLEKKYESNLKWRRKYTPFKQLRASDVQLEGASGLLSRQLATLASLGCEEASKQLKKQYEEKVQKGIDIALKDYKQRLQTSETTAKQQQQQQQQPIQVTVCCDTFFHHHAMATQHLPDTKRIYSSTPGFTFDEGGQTPEQLHQA